MAFSHITATLNPHLITQLDIHGLLSRLESELSIKAVYRKGKYNIDCSDVGTLKKCEALVNRFIAEAAEDDDAESDDEDTRSSSTFKAAQPPSVRSSSSPPYSTYGNASINHNNQFDPSTQEHDQTHYIQNMSPRGQNQNSNISRDQIAQHVTRPRDDSYQNDQSQSLPVNQYTNYGTNPNPGPNAYSTALRDREMQPNEVHFGEGHRRQISCSSGDSMPPLEQVSESEQLALRAQEYGMYGQQQYDMEDADGITAYPSQQNDQDGGLDAYHNERGNHTGEMQMHHNMQNQSRYEPIPGDRQPPQNSQQFRSDDDNTEGWQRDSPIQQLGGSGISPDMPRGKHLDSDDEPLQGATGDGCAEYVNDRVEHGESSGSRAKHADTHTKPTTETGPTSTGFDNDHDNDNDSDFDVPSSENAASTRPKRPSDNASTLTFTEDIYMDADIWEYMSAVFRDDLTGLEDAYGIIYDTKTAGENLEFHHVQVRGTTKESLYDGVNAIQSMCEKLSKECYRNMTTILEEVPNDLKEQALRKMKAKCPHLLIKESNEEQTKVIIIGERMATEKAMIEFKSLILVAPPQLRGMRPAGGSPATRPRDARSASSGRGRYRDDMQQKRSSKPKTRASSEGQRVPHEIQKQRSEGAAFKPIHNDGVDMERPHPEGYSYKRKAKSRGGEQANDWEPTVAFSDPKPLRRQDSDPFGEEVEDEEEEEEEEEEKPLITQQVESFDQQNAGETQPSQSIVTEGLTEPHKDLSPYRRSLMQTNLATTTASFDQAPANDFQLTENDYVSDVKPELIDASSTDRDSLPALEPIRSPILTPDGPAPNEDDDIQRAIDESLRDTNLRDPETAGNSRKTGPEVDPKTPSSAHAQRFDFTQHPGATAADDNDDADLEKALLESMRVYEEEQRQRESMTTFGHVTEQRQADDMPTSNQDRDSIGHVQGRVELLSSEDDATSSSNRDRSRSKVKPKVKSTHVLAYSTFDSDEEYAQSLKTSFREKKKRHGHHTAVARETEPLPSTNDSKKDGYPCGDEALVNDTILDDREHEAAENRYTYQGDADSHHDSATEETGCVQFDDEANNHKLDAMQENVQFEKPYGNFVEVVATGEGDFDLKELDSEPKGRSDTVSTDDIYSATDFPERSEQLSKDEINDIATKMSADQITDDSTAESNPPKAKGGRNPSNIVEKTERDFRKNEEMPEDPSNYSDPLSSQEEEMRRSDVSQTSIDEPTSHRDIPDKSTKSNEPYTVTKLDSEFSIDYEQHLVSMKSQSLEIQSLFNYLDMEETSPEIERLIDQILNGSQSRDPLAEFEATSAAFRELGLSHIETGNQPENYHGNEDSMSQDQAKAMGNRFSNSKHGFLGNEHEIATSDVVHGNQQRFIATELSPNSNEVRTLGDRLGNGDSSGHSIKESRTRIIDTTNTQGNHMEHTYCDTAIPKEHPHDWEQMHDDNVNASSHIPSKPPTRPADSNVMTISDKHANRAETTFKTLPTSVEPSACNSLSNTLPARLKYDEALQGYMLGPAAEVKACGAPDDRVKMAGNYENEALGLDDAVMEIGGEFEKANGTCVLECRSGYEDQINIENHNDLDELEFKDDSIDKMDTSRSRLPNQTAERFNEYRNSSQLQRDGHEMDSEENCNGPNGFTRSTAENRLCSESSDITEPSAHHSDKTEKSAHQDPYDAFKARAKGHPLDSTYVSLPSKITTCPSDIKVNGISRIKRQYETKSSETGVGTKRNIATWEINRAHQFEQDHPILNDPGSSFASLPYIADTDRQPDIKNKAKTATDSKTKLNLDLRVDEPKPIVLPPLPERVYQPKEGKFETRVDVNYRLPGYTSSGTILYIFDFPSGRMKGDGPYPMEEYQGTYFKTYLPINEEGNIVGNLLKEAFERDMLFTVTKTKDIHKNNITVPSVPLITDKRKFPNETYLEVIKQSLQQLLSREH